MQVSDHHIKEALSYAGIQEEKAEKIGKEYISSISNPTEEDLPFLSDLIPNTAAKAVKDNNEKILLKEEIKELNRKISEITETGGDIIIKVNSDKKDKIRRENINGENCLVIPVRDDENVKINV